MKSGLINFKSEILDMTKSFEHEKNNELTELEVKMKNQKTEFEIK